MGRNIAHNLALLGAKVRLITALGADDGAKRVEASCADLGIDLTDSLYVPDGATSTYLFLADSNGDMALAMNDMAIYEHLTPAFLETKLNALNAAALVVLDTNLSAESIRYLGEHCTAPLFADPVSAAKAGKLEPILGRLHTLKPNRMEAELLSGVAITGTEIAVLVVGCVVAFVVSLAAIRFLMDYVKRHNFKFFGLYRIVLGLIVLGVAAITAIA